MPAKRKIANPWDDVKLLVLLLIAATFIPIPRSCYYCGERIDGKMWAINELWIDGWLGGYVAHDDCDSHDRPMHLFRWEARPGPNYNYFPWWGAKAFWGAFMSLFLIALLVCVVRVWWMMYRLGNYHPSRMIQTFFLLAFVYLTPDLLAYAFDGTEAQEHVLEKYGLEELPYRTKIVWTPIPDVYRWQHTLQGFAAGIGFLAVSYFVCFYPHRKDPYGIEYASPRFAAVCQKLFGLSKCPEDVKLQNPKVEEERQEGPGAQTEAGPDSRAEVLRDREQAQSAAPAGGLHPDPGRRPDVQERADGSPGPALPDSQDSAEGPPHDARGDGHREG